MKLLFILFNLILILPIQSKPLVNAEWLSKNLCNKEIKVIEVGISFNSYLVEHIQCSQYTNFYKDKWRSNKNKVAMMLPLPEKIVDILEKLGVYDSDHVILYAKENTKYSMAETTSIYFTFKYLGHKKISILNGGYPAFKKQYDFFIEDGHYKDIKRSKYKTRINKKIIATYEDVVFSKENNYSLIDAREHDFYLGINKLKGFHKFGTIKGSINIPSKWFLEQRGLKFNNIDVLKMIFDSKKLKKNRNSIFFCYSGLESSINWFVSHELIKNQNAKLFEGSIFEWTSNKKALSKKFIKRYRH